LVNSGGMPVPVDDAKKTQILDAAFEKFLVYGVAKTSMADIATEAGVSRPALYLHYANKQAIFSACIERVLNGATAAALAELEVSGTVAERLDRFLQRSIGDLMERLRTSEHGADLIEAKAGYARDVFDSDSRRTRKGLASYLKSAAGPSVDSATVTVWVDLLKLSPVGFKADNPSVRTYRGRLSSLASLVALDVERVATVT
jgi:AcrR family transcriptional regulator